MKNVPVIGKMLVILSLFGLFVLGMAGYSGLKIGEIDSAYSNLLDQESAATLALARANRSMQNIRAAMGDVMMARSDDFSDRATKEINATKEGFVKYMDTAMAALPANQALAPLKAKTLKVMNETCGKALELGDKATSDADIAAAQTVYLAECQPAFAEIAPEFTQVVNDINKGASKRSDDLSALANFTRNVNLASSLAGLAAVMALGFFAIRSWLVIPLRRLAGTMETLASGNLSATIEGIDRRDEVGGMARAVQIFKDNGLRAREAEREAESNRNLNEAERARTAEQERQRASAMAQATEGLASGLKRLSQGDLTVRLSQPFSQEFESLRADFNATAEQLSETLTSVASATGSIEGGSREISQSANDLSKRTEQQAAALEETAAALDEITANVSNSSKRTEEARSVAAEANASARQSGAVVANAVDAMQRIEQSSSQISNIIGVIDEIAFQTNLLALNAGVEAARAGEAGKGFAVVAQEVRELAQRSAQAAKEIKELIRNSANEVENGVKLVTATGEALKVIESHVVNINSQLDAIATSAREQATGLAEVNTAVNQMDQTTQQNAAMVEEATAASSSLASEATRLRELVGQFKLDGRLPAAAKAPSATAKPATPPPAAPAAARTGKSAGRKPAPADASTRPVQSPARRMVGQVAQALGIGSAPKGEEWEEF
ncbi:methyl-accepting chemotaxis protein [Allorhizobium undicola]|uniref:methyl-accepting chemotaxis protein n=1 Tax=Allorhizobium undicola TaxID=78527 RepID=UPI000486E11A|nr:HAMP domain-containing methyl-accepting chemotaxis protein [Allorhizobium undicola]